MRTQFEIRDWADNSMFNGKTFPTFEDGWAYIYEMLPDADDQALAEYYVLKKGELK